MIRVIAALSRECKPAFVPPPIPKFTVQHNEHSLPANAIVQTDRQHFFFLKKVTVDPPSNIPLYFGRIIGRSLFCFDNNMELHRIDNSSFEVDNSQKRNPFYDVKSRKITTYGALYSLDQCPHNDLDRPYGFRMDRKKLAELLGCYAFCKTDADYLSEIWEQGINPLSRLAEPSMIDTVRDTLGFVSVEDVFETLSHLDHVLVDFVIHIGATTPDNFLRGSFNVESRWKTTKETTMEWPLAVHTITNNDVNDVHNVHLKFGDFYYRVVIDNGSVSWDRVTQKTFDYAANDTESVWYG